MSDLIAFAETDKFEGYGHLEPAVMDADEDIKEEFNDLWNDCANELMEVIQSGTQIDGDVRKVIYRYYQKASNEIGDTEDWDFGQKIAIILGEISQVDMLPIFQKNIEDQLETVPDLQTLLRQVQLSPEQEAGLHQLIHKLRQ